MELHRSRDEDELEVMQCNGDENGAVVKQSSPVNEVPVMQRCSQEVKAEEKRRSGEEAEAGEMQGNHEEDESVERHISGRGRGDAEQLPRRRRRGEALKQQRGGYPGATPPSGRPTGKCPQRPWTRATVPGTSLCHAR